MATNDSRETIQAVINFRAILEPYLPEWRHNETSAELMSRLANEGSKQRFEDAYLIFSIAEHCVRNAALRCADGPQMITIAHLEEIRRALVLEIELLNKATQGRILAEARGKASTQWTADIDREARRIFSDIKQANPVPSDEAAYRNTASKLYQAGYGEISSKTLRRRLPGTASE